MIYRLNFSSSFCSFSDRPSLYRWYYAYGGIVFSPEREGSEIDAFLVGHVESFVDDEQSRVVLLEGLPFVGPLRPCR